MTLHDKTLLALARTHTRVILTHWLGALVVRTLDLRLSVAGSISGHDTARLYLR